MSTKTTHFNFTDRRITEVNGIKLKSPMSVLDVLVFEVTMLALMFVSIRIGMINATAGWATFITVFGGSVVWSRLAKRDYYKIISDFLIALIVPKEY